MDMEEPLHLRAIWLALQNPAPHKGMIVDIINTATRTPYRVDLSNMSSESRSLGDHETTCIILPTYVNALLSKLVLNNPIFSVFYMSFHL